MRAENLVSEKNKKPLETIFRSMASDVTIHISSPAADALAAVERAKKIFRDVEEECSRFKPKSSLMKINASHRSWSTTTDICRDVIQNAYRAYEETKGLFDPRILNALKALGYSRSMETSPSEPKVELELFPGNIALSEIPWNLERRGNEIMLGDFPIDLGGIGKGYAVKCAAKELANSGSGFLIEAGGDICVGGLTDEGGLWKIGVEDPFGESNEPIAVLEGTDIGVATSSTRNRSWKIAGRDVHHLVDPRTRQPGGGGLLAVTVIANDAMQAEVWSKTLFLHGLESIDREATAHNFATLWVSNTGKVGMTSNMRTFCIWQKD